MRTGSTNTWRANFSIFFLKVALKSKTCRSGLTWPAIEVTCGSKPMSNMRSASSSTKNSARRSDQELDALLASQRLLVQTAAAVCTRTRDVVDFGKFFGLCVNLLHQFSGRRQDKHYGSILWLKLFLVHNVSQSWPQISICFSAAGLGNANDVATGQRNWHGLRLNWSGRSEF
ncbi:hypothetical protein BpHYR1_030172 [Brachionus plicatilis]|uniref:Uncharacterized protein n=1 Tax=Brachionus plicatilis TaxID=10195 RepID=A0A3M7RGA9_BRAPC|nr:hypothetical protein BpHYR1_030172 [Brachionus plicatilis]